MDMATATVVNGHGGMISKHLSRDIYYAKYYGKGGGENGQLGKKIRS